MVIVVDSISSQVPITQLPISGHVAALVGGVEFVWGGDGHGVARGGVQRPAVRVAWVGGVSEALAVARLLGAQIHLVEEGAEGRVGVAFPALRRLVVLLVAEA